MFGDIADGTREEMLQEALDEAVMLIKQVIEDKTLHHCLWCGKMRGHQDYCALLMWRERAKKALDYQEK